MKVKELIEYLNMFNPEDNVLISSDEEMNTLYKEFDIAELEDKTIKNSVVVCGLSGSEI